MVSQTVCLGNAGVPQSTPVKSRTAKFPRPSFPLSKASYRFKHHLGILEPFIHALLQTKMLPSMCIVVYKFCGLLHRPIASMSRLGRAPRLPVPRTVNDSIFAGSMSQILGSEFRKLFTGPKVCDLEWCVMEGRVCETNFLQYFSSREIREN